MSSKSWTHPLFDCFNPMGLCCLSFWCPCILYGKTHGDRSGAGCCILSCCGLQPFLQCITRGGMRHMYRIDGNPCNDFLTSWCCPCCVLVQEAKELKEQKEGSSGNEQGYTSQPEMNYGPQ